ncbi:MAG: hypothetical protein HFK05_03530 [Clostridia bacterium]|nr:hypothetical protein [Clostridia bacterium]
MDYLSLKNAIFFPDKIVLFKKKGKVVIEIGSIDRIEYAKPSLLNYIFASVWFGGTFPGRLEIYLKNDPLTKRKHWTLLYLIRIKFKDYLKIPPVYRTRFNLRYFS